MNFSIKINCNRKTYKIYNRDRYTHKIYSIKKKIQGCIYEKYQYLKKKINLYKTKKKSHKSYLTL